MQDVWECNTADGAFCTSNDGFMASRQSRPMGTFMKRIFINALLALFSLGVVLSQTKVNSDAKSSGLGKPQAASNEETNIRAYIELLRTSLKDSKAEVMGEVMRLNAAEAAKFWPIYKDFEKEYGALGDQIIAAVKKYTENYDSLTETVCDELAKQVLTIEQERLALKRKYYDRMKSELGAMTAMRFLQVENQLERIVDLQVAAQLPVTGER